MSKCTKEIEFIKDESTWSVLEQVAREGARRMLQPALENEVEEFVQKHSNLTDEDSRKVVAKNGYMPQGISSRGWEKIEVGILKIK